jgi:phosphoadenosine phosphosulfate reductase
MPADRLSALEEESFRIIDDALDAGAPSCATCSFQSGGVVLLHMLRQRRPRIPVLFLDTFHHFAETLAYRDSMAAAWDLNLVTLAAREPSVGLWRTSTDACCQHHKTDPLFAALEPYAVWFSGLRRDQSPSRADLKVVAPFRLPSGTVLTKVSPLAGWTTADVWRYAKAHEIPLLPLYDEGFTSIGCAPCTTLPLDVSNLRSGRWRGEKLECGIHVEPVAGSVFS